MPDVYTRDGYTSSKWWQERVTRRFVKQYGWELTVLRPGFIWGRDHGYLAALGQQFGRYHLVIGPLTHIPMTHVENCADVFALAAADARAWGQTLNIIDGPGERIWRYLSNYLRLSGQPGWCMPIPYTLAIWAVRLAFATVFRRATKLPGILIPRRFESRFRPSDLRTGGCGRRWAGPPPTQLPAAPGADLRFSSGAHSQTRGRSVRSLWSSIGSVALLLKTQVEAALLHHNN